MTEAKATPKHRTDVLIRPLEARDEAQWRRLWTGYLDYYETKVPEVVYATTFARLLSGAANEFAGWWQSLTACRSA